MSVAEMVQRGVKGLPTGKVFTYEDFMGKISQKEAVIKALNRLVQSGKIAKLSKGRFYKPEDSAFGQLLPRQEEVVKDLLQENGKVTGYLTGYSVYNQLGLTTQVSNIIQIGKNQIRPKFERGDYTISFILQKNTITRENIPLLKILDAIRYVKKIPDTSIEMACKRFLVLLRNLTEKEQSAIVRLALKYPPSARALLGALLEEINEIGLTAELFQSLNPITKYKLAGADKVLSYATKWNIV